MLTPSLHGWGAVPISHVMDTRGCCIAACPNVYVFVPFQLQTVHFRAAHALAGTSISGEKQNYCMSNSLKILLILPFRLVLFNIYIVWSRCLSQPLPMPQLSKFRGLFWGKPVVLWGITEHLPDLFSSCSLAHDKEQLWWLNDSVKTGIWRPSQ